MRWEANGVKDFDHMLPSDLFSWTSLFTTKGVFLIIVGGFLTGFGTRYAGGCTSGHSIMGISNLQWPSLVAYYLFYDWWHFDDLVCFTIHFKFIKHGK